MSVEYAGERTTFGVPIGAKQGVAFQIADLEVMLEASRMLTYKAAAMKDAGRPMKEFKQAAAIAKLYATESAVTATRIATQVFGGYGFMEEYPVDPVLPRRQGPGDRRGHLRGAADADRARARPARGVNARLPGNNAGLSTLVAVGHRWQRFLSEGAKFLTVGGVATLVSLRDLQRAGARLLRRARPDARRPAGRLRAREHRRHGRQLPRQPLLGVPGPRGGRASPVAGWPSS